MKSPSEIILSEIKDVASVVQSACMVESAIRGQPVSPHDPNVQVRAADIILAGVGAHLRGVAGNEPMRDNR